MSDHQLSVSLQANNRPSDQTIKCHNFLRECDSFLTVTFSSPFVFFFSGTMDLSAPAPVVALLLRWPQLLLPISSLPFPLSTTPLPPHPHPLLPHVSDPGWSFRPSTTWQERKGRLSEAPWTSSAWRASSREELDVCWWLTAGHFLSTMRRTYKARSTSAVPSWWRDDCSRTRCLSLSCCNQTARWRWVKAPWQLLFGW